MDYFNTKSDSVIIPTEEDLRYFRDRISRAEKNPAAQEKYRKQLAFLEDAVVIYKLTSGPRKDDR